MLLLLKLNDFVVAMLCDVVFLNIFYDFFELHIKQ